MNGISIQFTPEAQAVIARMGRLPESVLPVLAKELDLQNELTTGHIILKRMSARGPETLGVRTGRLRRSVRPARTVITGTTLRSSIGSNVKYMGPHEFGFKGTVQVPSHRRKVASRNVFQVGPKGGRKKVASGVTIVRAHAMKMNVKERAPIRKGIMDRVEFYRLGLSRAIIDHANGGAA